LVGAQIAATLPVVTDRIERELQARVLQPYRAIDDWWWLGKQGDRPVNNWNPWINSNILATNLLIEPDSAVREQTVLRAIESVDLFLDGYHPDGGCDEGTSYWGRAGASLYDCLDLLSSASGGQLDAFDIPLVQEIGRYIYRMHIGGRWFVNFADGAAQVSLDGPIVYQYGRRIGDPKMAAQGAVAWREQAERLPGSGSIGRALRDLAIEPEIAAADATPPLIAQAWLPGTEILTAREREGSTDGLFLAVKGGHNAESHNHNDVGSFIVALDGAPVIIDAGVGVYTRQTFSAERYTIWTMQSAYHNLPLIDGHQQAPGREYHARDVHADITPEHAALTLDIAGAYPAEVGLRRWERTVRLERGANTRIVLDDRYDLDHQPQTLALHLLVAGPVDTTAPGVLRCAGAQRALAVHYDPDIFTATAETITIDDARLGGVWGERIGRIILAVRQPQAQGDWSLTMTA
ncbi:MAG: heparinase II/III domain-containing protein, partial [Thermomicrobiales bacterium]